MTTRKMEIRARMKWCVVFKVYKYVFIILIYANKFMDE